MEIDDKFFMKLAINEAWKYQFITFPNPAVGCVIVKNNSEILSIEAHKQAGKEHAEINALKKAFLKYHPNSILKTFNNSFEIHKYLRENHNDFFCDCTIYVTLEPCNHMGKTPSCAKLIEKLRPKRVVIGHKDLNNVAKGGQKTLEGAKIPCEIGVMEKEAYNLLFPFLKWSSSTFIFYKMAQTLNGTIDGGKISSNRTLAYVHTLRNKIDLMLIGGNSVRIDKPTLDARYIAGRAPDVMIYSKNRVFDEKIPLFKVPNRKVIISNDLFKLLDYKFVMVEGGYTLLKKLEKKIDFLVLLVTPKIRDGLNSIGKIDINFEIIHENYMGEDKIIYLRRKKKK